MHTVNFSTKACRLRPSHFVIGDVRYSHGNIDLTGQKKNRATILVDVNLFYVQQLLNALLVLLLTL